MKRLPWVLRVGVAGLAFAWAFGLAGPARADAAADDAKQRERIRTEREAVQATYRQQVEECNTRFVVTSCVDAARAQRHAALDKLDKQQLVLDEARRAQRAAERTEAIESKVSGEEARRREEAARERSATRRDAPADAAKPAASAASAAPRAARAASTPAERAQSEARARRAYELKQLQAEAHRQEVARRNQERAKKANPGAPLPVPSASAVMQGTSEPAR